MDKGKDQEDNWGSGTALRPYKCKAPRYSLTGQGGGKTIRFNIRTNPSGKRAGVDRGNGSYRKGLVKPGEIIDDSEIAEIVSSGGTSLGEIELSLMLRKLTKCH